MSTRKRRPHKRPADDTSSRERAPFTFEWPKGSGQRYSLPTQLKFGVLRRASKAGNDFDQICAVLEAVADPDALAAIDDMDVPEVERLFVRWQRHMGVSVGES
jgi:hypothetical protein